MKFKLGLKPVEKPDPRRLLFARYISRLPEAPATCKWSAPVKKWPMMQNDKMGNCAVAAAAHMIQCWTANESREIIIPDKAVVKAYSDLSGYDPATGENDNGVDMASMMKYWQKTGVGGRKSYAYTVIDPRRKTHVIAAIYIFGGADLGLALPLSSERQTGPGKLWDVPRTGSRIGPGRFGSLGGHSVPVVDYTADGPVCVTWGFLQRMTWRFLAAYGMPNSNMAVLSRDWNSEEPSPSGFKWNQLEADLAAL